MHAWRQDLLAADATAADPADNGSSTSTVTALYPPHLAMSELTAGIKAGRCVPVPEPAWPKKFIQFV